MAGKRRNWKLKDGRHYARLAVPKALQGILGKSELIEALGADLGVATKDHPAAVARLRSKIADAARSLEAPAAEAQSGIPADRGPPRRPIEPPDIDRAVRDHYDQTLAADMERRAAMPTEADLLAEAKRVRERFEAEEIDFIDDLAVISASSDYEFLRNARPADLNLRQRRYASLKADLHAGDLHRVRDLVNRILSDRGLVAEQDGFPWRKLALGLMRAEISALEATFDRDRGLFDQHAVDPVVKPQVQLEKAAEAVSLHHLFVDYIKSRQILGKHSDGGSTWRVVVADLAAFLGHDDALKISRRNLIDWRDRLLATGKSPKTVSDKYLAAIGAILKWAHENERLPTNEASSVRQEVPRQNQTREKGYTNGEAQKVLKASIHHVPATYPDGRVRESPEITAAKTWVPLLCAFTGARVTEITQLRKEDVRREGQRLIIRITPDAGSVKTGQYRDVPLHRQVMQLGFDAFVSAAAPGPLFHNATSPAQYVSRARRTSGEISKWLHRKNLVPDGVDPSHGWRHRFKTLGRELGLSGRVLDAIQGHAGKTASDSYGDVNVEAKIRVIDALPVYDLSD